jgi:hypothetical protein
LSNYLTSILVTFIDIKTIMFTGQPEKKIKSKTETITEALLELSLIDDKLEYSEEQESNSNDIVFNITDTSVPTVFEFGENTVSENPEDLTNHTVTNDVQEIVENADIKENDNINEEASAIKDSKSINNSRENINSFVCISMCYLFLICYS